ncbi:DUF550 domain-containing protein [Salmonella enterica]|nr:DUF550 domain-containing protein [Salmonella enterica]
MTTITRERLLKIQHWRETYGADSNVMLPAEEAEELARIALAALEAEPVASCIIEDGGMCVDGFGEYVGHSLPDGTHQLYAAPPAPERERIRREHAEWSDATFGNVGPIGPLKHLSKEAMEAAADPSDPLEWADMQFLLWDAQRRMGISDEFITRAMIEKLAINKARQWPEPKDGQRHRYRCALPLIAKTDTFGKHKRKVGNSPTGFRSIWIMFVTMQDSLIPRHMFKTNKGIDSEGSYHPLCSERIRSGHIQSR